ncbi:hypothetical protein VKT23_018796 [Stygiomarasmius scandens]|uniref:Uncharacterized protein n=1 Tax=Marasmiellus scandens TaxID=2682957 RepID=A0ABR1IRD3_9AGAR
MVSLIPDSPEPQLAYVLVEPSPQPKLDPTEETSATSADARANVDVSTSPSVDALDDLEPSIDPELSLEGSSRSRLLQIYDFIWNLFTAIWVSFQITSLRRGVSVVFFGTRYVFRVEHVVLVLISVLSTEVVFPYSALESSSGPLVVDYGQLMNIQNTTVTNLLGSTGVSYLAADIKQTEMATSELAMIVYHSDLPSHDLLAEHLKSLAFVASVTSESLLDFDAGIVTLVDKLLDFNGRNLRYLQAIENKNVFQRTIQSLKSYHGEEDAELVARFVQSMDYLSNVVKTLIMETQRHISPLKKMEMQLKEIHEIVGQDRSEVTGAYEEVLASLWTKLGGNQRQKEGFENNLVLLRNIDDYRKQAQSHVNGALIQLGLMQRKMEQLRLRLRAPGLLGPRIAMADHVQSIEIGIKNLWEAKQSIQAREAEMIGQFR